MNRRDFLTYSALGLAWMSLGGFEAHGRGRYPRSGSYNLVILGDTHYDTEPASVYHSDYNEPTEWLNRVQRAEFARNGEMWRDRCRRLVRRAACLVDDNTRLVLQVGDLIQGDCGNPEVHVRMLEDTMAYLKGEFGRDLPLVTTAGNHDIRGTDARAAYNAWLPERMSRELGQTIAKTTFGFSLADDAYLILDFNKPDDAETEKLLAEYQGARHTFIVVHGPVFPIDCGNCYWFYHGKQRDKDIRLHFRRLFAERNAIVLTGHSHTTEQYDWVGDGGRISQMVFNSVWSTEEKGKYVVDARSAAEYGSLRARLKFKDNGDPIKDETPLFDEYRDGLRLYTHSPAAGSYKLNVGPTHITVDFYAGDSARRSERFILR